MPNSTDIGKAFLKKNGNGSRHAARWLGWGTGLKPAHEPILQCQKPIE